MVKSGDQHGHSLDMVHAHIELVLQHPSPLITHCCKSIFPLLSSLRTHIPKGQRGNNRPIQNPSKQKPLHPCLSNPSKPNILAIVVMDLATVPINHIPKIQEHLSTITKKARLGIHHKLNQFTESTWKIQQHSIKTTCPSFKASPSTLEKVKLNKQQ